MEIITDGPSELWVCLVNRSPGLVLLAMEECGYLVDWIPQNWAGSQED
jgi:hypothetical protein